MDDSPRSPFNTLFEQAQLGDSTAMHALWVEAEPRLRGLLQAEIGDGVVDGKSADDFVQIVRQRMVERLPQLQQRHWSGFLGWTLRIAMNELNSAFRRDRRQDPLPSGSLLDAVLSAGSQGTPSKGLMQAELVAWVTDFIDQEPEDETRQIVKLHVFDRLPDTAIAEKVGRDRKTVQTRLLKFVDRLRRDAIERGFLSR